MILLDPGGSMVLKPAPDARSTATAAMALAICLAIQDITGAHIIQTEGDLCPQLAKGRESL